MLNSRLHARLPQAKLVLKSTASEQTGRPREAIALAEDEKRNREDTLSRTASAYQKAAPVLDAVWQLIGATLLGTLGGWWLDTKFETAPWLLVAGAVLGVVTGLYAFIRAALPSSRKSPKKPDRAEP